MIRPSRCIRRSVNGPAHRRRPPGFQLAAVLALLAAIGGDAAHAQTLTLDNRLVVFSACAGGPNPPARTVSITNGGAGSLTWQLGNPSGLAAWLTVSPASGSAPATLSLSADVAGLAPGQYQDTVQVTSNDPTNPVRTIVVALSVARCPPPVNAGTYQVELRFTGYTGLITADDCAVDPQGYDVLEGTVTGVESPARDEDVVYRGTLRRLTVIDFCDSRGRRGVGDDERVLCTVKLTGSAVIDVELTVYGEEGRGAYLETTSWSSPVEKTATGDCQAPETAQILADYPTASEGGGATPNGQPIDDPQSLLFANGLARLRVGYWPPEQSDGWALRVIRKLR